MTDSLTLPVEVWSIEKLRPYALNAKKHPPEQIETLCASIRKFGWNQPIVVWTDGTIIAGHGRRLAALALGLKVVPVVVRSDLTQAEADALRIADNKTSSTEYDIDLMAESLSAINAQLAELDDTEDLIAAMGLSDREVAMFLEGDLAEMNFDEMVEDVGAAVKLQAEENEAKLQETDKSAAPVGDALGFKRVTIEESRALRSVMQKIETKTGQTGAPALIAFLNQALEAV